MVHVPKMGYDLYYRKIKIDYFSNKNFVNYYFNKILRTVVTIN